MSSRFEQAIELIDRANAQDPEMVDTAQGERPGELVYAERMSETLNRIYPQASEELQLAVRAQHLRRWTRPRSEYPMDRKGYHAWRNAAKIKHAEEAGGLLEEAGYGADVIDRVQALIRKEGLKRDEEAQALEDVACLVFLEHYFSAFAKKHENEHEKLIGIVRKTWNKMSETGQKAALDLPLDDVTSGLIREALAA